MAQEKWSRGDKIALASLLVTVAGLYSIWQSIHQFNIEQKQLNIEQKADDDRQKREYVAGLCATIAGAAASYAKTPWDLKKDSAQRLEFFSVYNGAFNALPADEKGIVDAVNAYWAVAQSFDCDKDPKKCNRADRSQNPLGKTDPVTADDFTNQAKAIGQACANLWK